MAKKSETPFHKIMVTRQKLRLYVEYGDHALDGQTIQQFAGDVLECLETLVEFRNIVNGMASLEQKPSFAVIPYLSDDALAAAAGSLTT